MVSSDSIKNFRVTVQDIVNARKIYGPNQPGLIGRLNRKKPKRVRPEYMGIPCGIYERHTYVVLTEDVMFVNGITFLLILSRGIRLYTCKHVPNRKAPQLSASLKKIVNLCARREFIVRTVIMDMEFEKVKEQEGMVLV